MSFGSLSPAAESAPPPLAEGVLLSGKARTSTTSTAVHSSRSFLKRLSSSSGWRLPSLPKQQLWQLRPYAEGLVVDISRFTKFVDSRGTLFLSNSHDHGVPPRRAALPMESCLELLEKPLFFCSSLATQALAPWEPEVKARQSPACAS